MRLMGKRQLGELQPEELVSTILISNLASISIESEEVPVTASLHPAFSDRRAGTAGVCAQFPEPVVFQSDVRAAQDRDPGWANRPERFTDASADCDRSDGGPARKGHF